MYTKHLEERAKIEKDNKAIPEKNKKERKMNGIISNMMKKRKEETPRDRTWEELLSSLEPEMLKGNRGFVCTPLTNLKPFSSFHPRTDSFLPLSLQPFRALEASFACTRASQTRHSLLTASKHPSSVPQALFFHLGSATPFSPSEGTSAPASLTHAHH